VSRLRGLAALSTFLVASPALAFVRSTTSTPGTGKPLFWKNPQVTFNVNPSHFNSIPGCTTSADAMALVRASIPTWNLVKHPGESAACTTFNFVDGGDSASTSLGFDQTAGAHNENLVIFRGGNCSTIADTLCTSPPLDSSGQPDLGACVAKYNCWEHDTTIGGGGTIALTTVTFDPNTGEIFDADMELQDWNGKANAPTGWYFTCPGPGAPTCAGSPSNPLLYGESNCIFMDIGNTVTHEAGHMLGLDHVCVAEAADATHACPDPSATMAPTAGAGDTDKRTLTADDINGVCSIYPAKDTGGCGCGTASASGLALLGLFLAALRPRRRLRVSGPR
jgi:MYXO-CTERM domain-containing protein